MNALEKHHLIGMDGGGTKTRVVARNPQKDTLLFDKRYDPTNYQTTGAEAVTDIFRVIVSDLRSLLGDELEHSVLVAGMAGVDRPKDAVAYRRMLADAGYPGTAVVCNDMDIALMGAHCGSAGAYLNCGTGSIAVGRAGGGETARAGGWGALFGDEGSGYRLGLEAVAAVFRAYDKVGPATVLTGEVLSALGLEQAPDILDLICCADTLPVQKLASLAPAVTAHCETDAVCRAIVEKQTALCVGLVVGLTRQLGCDALPLALGGSLLTKSESYRAAFLRALSRQLPHMTPTTPRLDPVQGALLLAEQALGGVDP